nr:methylmalonyl Co-A mutase-associated GTPase MeaB [Ornithinimicrobium sp. HY1745]
MALARLLTWIEHGDERADHVERDLDLSHDGTVVVGITGAPGAGKSTLVSGMTRRLRLRGETVGVLAVDPSSATTGGALLGDRVRMGEHLTDQGVFIRSMANRGQLGGLAAAVPGAVRAMIAFGFDWVIVETVGVGQLEIDVINQVDTTLVLVAPGGGDDVQAVKSGIMEIADILVVNKSDLPGADRTVRELTATVRLGRPEAGAWRTPVVATNSEDCDGLEALLASVVEHLRHITGSGVLDERRRDRRLHEWQAGLLRQFAHLAREVCEGGFDEGKLLAAVQSGETPPAAAALAVRRRVDAALRIDT